jgi:hypothetical protein
MRNLQWSAMTLFAISFAACKKDDNKGAQTMPVTISVDNVINSKNLVESGTFKGTGANAPLIMPGESVSVTFSAAPGQAFSFAAMYGWSNDLFFAPANPGIALYDANKNPIEGDVSSSIKLWDNGTRVNQVPGASVAHPGTADSKNVTEVAGTDAYGNTYLAASALVSATLKYNGNAMFTLTLTNTSGGTANETPLSPGVWAISYIVGGTLNNAAPLYTAGSPTANGLTDIAEKGDTTALASYVKSNTGLFTPLSPILVVVYNGVSNPIFKAGEKDRGEGLTAIAQKGDASTLSAFLKTQKGVKQVYVLAAPTATVLLPIIGANAGGHVSQALDVAKGDSVAIATMYGFSSDWFFATPNGADATKTGDLSSTVQLYDDGTAVDQYPGAGNALFNLGGNTNAESKVIAPVPNPNAFTTLPAINNIIKVTIQ